MASLETVPAEVSSQILSYLIRPFSGLPMDGKPRTSRLYRFMREWLPCSRDMVTEHPFYVLAATSRGLRLAVEGFCQHLLHHPTYNKNLKLKIPTTDPADWSQAVAGPPGKTSAAALARSRKGCVSYRMLWVMRATFQRCIWCGKASKRRGTFDMFVWVCADCDREQYGHPIVR